MMKEAQHKRLQWRMLLLTMFCYLFFYTGRHNFGWASKPLAAALNISFEKIGWISFAMLIGYAIGQFINGNLADRLSPKHMIATGGILSVAANVAISFSHSYSVILILWCLNGYFQSMAWAPGSRIIANWWPKEKQGMAFGLYTMSAASSSVITYLFSIMLVNESWQNLFRIPLLFLLVAVILFFFLVKNKPERERLEVAEAVNKNEDLNKVNWKEGYKTAIQNRNILITCISIGFQSMARYGLIFWLPVYFLGDNFKSSPDSVWVSILLPIGMTVGAISFGVIADRLFKGQKTRSISFGMFMCFLVSILIFLLPVKNHFLMGIFIFLAGFFSYGPQANFWPLSQEFLGKKYMGTGIGIMNMCAYIFAAVGEPLIGKAVDIFKHESMIFIVVGISALLSSIIILFAKRSN